MKMTTEPLGTNCRGGGLRVDVGLDNGDGGGTARNAVLETGEIDQTSYVCTPVPKRVFVTSTTTAGAMGGVSGGDAICQTRANAAALGGSYLAWLADTATASPASRFTKSVMPYVLVNGTKVADNYTDLTDGTLDNAINVTELNGSYTGSVWTSVTSSGAFSSSVQCNGWTSNASAVTGLNGTANAVDQTWTAAGGTFCNSTFALYCFEQ